jgi:hypothetical protein
MAKGAPKSTGMAPKPQAGQQATTGATAPAAAQKTAAKPAQKGTADPVGDICLLPEIAGLAH